MRKYLKFNLILLGTITILTSCKKDDSFLNTSNIVVGDVTNMIIHSFDTLVSLGAPHDELYFELDIDENGINDYRLSSYFTVSPSGFSDASEFKIECLAGHSYINVVNFLDTTFFSTSVDTNYYDNNIYIVTYDKYSCTKMGLNDSIISFTEKTYIQSKQQEDSLSKEDMWSANSFRISDGGIIHNWEIISQILDPIIIHDYTYTSNCHPLYNNGIAYIGIKIENQESYKLGWIKHERLENYNVKLVETAMHK